MGLEVSNQVKEGKLVLSLKGQEVELTPLATNEFWNRAYGFFFRFSHDGKQLFIYDVDSVYELSKL